jgi:hypothetical protein
MLDDVQVCRHWVRFYTAARALIAAGANPDATLRMRHRGSTMQWPARVGAMAKWTVSAPMWLHSQRIRAISQDGQVRVATHRGRPEIRLPPM